MSHPNDFLISRLSSSKNISISETPLTVANVYLEKSYCVKYLGVYIDCNLTWHNHIDYICGKISQNVNIMIKLKLYVSKATLVSLYYSLIYPYLTYACILWGNNYNAPLSQIVKLQNKAVRVINDVPLMEPITPHYLSLHLLKFPDIVKLNTCTLFYDYFHHEKFPNIPVSLVSELHNYNTRSASSNQIFIPPFRTNLRRFCPSIIGCFFWNDIPQLIRDKPSKKNILKSTFALVPCSILMKHYLLHNLPKYFPLPFSFFKINYQVLSHVTFRGTTLVNLDVPHSSPSIITCEII